MTNLSERRALANHECDTAVTVAKEELQLLVHQRVQALVDTVRTALLRSDVDRVTSEGKTRHVSRSGDAQLTCDLEFIVAVDRAGSDTSVRFCIEGDLVKVF